MEKTQNGAKHALPLVLGLALLAALVTNAPEAADACREGLGVCARLPRRRCGFSG